MTFEIFQAFPDLASHQRGQTLGSLIEDQQPGIEHQCPANRQHLLFASGKRGAPVVLSRRECREKVQYPL